MNDIEKLKHLEMETQRLQFRYLKNLMLENNLYRGDPRLLMYVFFHDGRKQAEIANGLCIKPATLTVMLQRMEQAGLVERKSDPQDQRVQRVYITELGKKTSEKTVEVYKNAVRSFYLGVTEEEIQGYQCTLEKVKKNVLKLLEETTDSDGSKKEGDETTCLSLQNM